MNSDLPTHFSRRWQTAFLAFAIAALAPSTMAYSADAEKSPPLDIPEANATAEAEMQPYTELIEHTEAEIEMVPIPAGKFVMGSPANEVDRVDDEGPQHEVEIAPFWMGRHEITWDAYEIWCDDIDILRRKITGASETPRDPIADAVTRPTEPYTDMSFGLGMGAHPAICMTQHAARTYCRWLSAKTGRYYRLPTEAEWEYACRAGTSTAYYFGDDTAKLEDHAWFVDNSNEEYHEVGLKNPNPWGLFDMHGNVSEWVLDQHVADSYNIRKGKLTTNPLAIPTQLYPRVVRGGGWDDNPIDLRSAARMTSSDEWKEQDPQIPKSIWYHTDAISVGFRIVRPLVEPSAEEKVAKWENTAPEQIDPEE